MNKANVVVISGSDSDTDVTASAKAETEALFDDSDEELKQKLKQYDASCQKDRKKDKEVMTLKKAEAAKEKSAKEEATKKAKTTKAKTTKAKAKTTKAKAKTTKAKTPTKAKTAKGKAKTTKAKTPTKVKTAKAKAKTTKAEGTNVEAADAFGQTPLKVGMRVSGRWNGHGSQKGFWFDGTVHSVDIGKQTIHIKFDDGDEDDSLAWHHVSIISDESCG